MEKRRNPGLRSEPPREIGQSVYAPGFGFVEPDDVKYHFSGHETFPFRYTWLPKGVRNSETDPKLFKSDDAIVKLGVGKNMVRSIRHWCDTLGLIESVPGKRGQYRPTLLGRALFSQDGWDPYLEDPGTLWLLHWYLTSRWDRASTWFLAFTRWNTDDFTRDQLRDWLWHLKETESPASRGTKASLKRDVDTFLRTYVPSRVTATRPLEDTFDCPLVELGLITEVSRNTYTFVRGPKSSLPDGIFVYALLEFWHMKAARRKTLSFEMLMHGQGSPGRAFKLSDNALVERLERLPVWTELTYGDTAGQRLVYLRSDKVMTAMEALSDYYGTYELAS